MIKGTFAPKYVEHEIIHPIALIYTAICAKISLAYSLYVHGRPIKRISTSEFGRDNPIAFDPKSIVLTRGYIL